MPPFTYKDPDGSYGGWEYHVVASLAKNMNFSLDINPPPNGELWGENKNGTFTGTVVANSTCSVLKPSISPSNVAKMQIQGQFWKLLVLGIPKHPQHVKID